MELVLESVLRVIPVWVVSTNGSLSHEIEAGLRGIEMFRYGGAFPSWQAALGHIKAQINTDGQILLAEGHSGNPAGFRWVSMVKGVISTISVIALIDESDKEAITSAIDAGVSGYLARSCPVTQMVSAIMTAASGGIAVSPSIMDKIIALGASGNLSGSPHKLTKRENDILRLLIEGNSVREIADKLSISYYTADTHLRNIHRKFGVKSSRSLMSIVIREHIL